MNNPSVFIRASPHGADFARAIQNLLAPDAEITISGEAPASLENASIGALLQSLPRVDFAVLVLTPADLEKTGDGEKLRLTDHFVFELGLFTARLGRERTFVVQQANSEAKLPTELNGVNAVGYDWPSPDGSRRSALGAACKTIRQAIHDLGFSETRIDILALAKDVQRNREQIDDITYLLVHFISQFEWNHLRTLAGGGDFPYEMQQVFEKELEHLLELHCIEKTHDFRIPHMPLIGNLRNYFKISDKGKTFLKLRDGYAPEDSTAEVVPRRTMQQILKSLPYFTT